MISEDFIKNFKMLKGRLVHFVTFSDFSEDFQRFSKILKLVEMLLFALSGAFS